VNDLHVRTGHDSVERRSRTVRGSVVDDDDLARCGKVDRAQAIRQLFEDLAGD